MGYVNSRPEDDLNFQATAEANPIQQITPNNWYDGIAGAIPRGVTNAFLKTNDALNEVLAPVDKLLGIEKLNESMSVDIPKSLEQWAKPDARYQAAPAQIIQSVTEGLGLAASGAALGGPIGAAAMLGGVEGHATYQEQRQAGVDADTAVKTAGVTGVVNALGVFLPMAVTKSAVVGIMGRAMAAEAAGNTTLARTLFALGETAAPVAGKVSGSVGLGVGTNVLTGMAQRGLTGEILRENGYDKLAEQYRVYDAQSMIADVILGAAFGGLAHLSDADRVPPSMVDEAMAIKKQEHFDRAGLGIPTDPLAANVHNDVMARSIEDLIMGKTGASVTPDEANTIVNNIVPDPETELMYRQQFDALESVFGVADELGTPTMLLDTNLDASRQVDQVWRLMERVKAATGGEIDIQMSKADLLDAVNTKGGETVNNTITLLTEQLGRHSWARADRAEREAMLSEAGIKNIKARKSGEGDYIDQPWDALDSKQRQKIADSLAAKNTESEPVATTPKVEGEAPAAQINPLKQETLDQLVMRNPDMPVQLGDGREVRVADLPSILESDMAKAKKDSVLHDIAAACFVRTSS